MEKEYCNWCEEEKDFDKLTKTRDFGYICDECLKEHFTRCPDCDNWVEKDSTYHVYYFKTINGMETKLEKDVCENCFEGFYYCCQDCEDAYPEDDTYIDEGGICVCPDCYNKHYGKCQYCEYIFAQDNLINTPSGWVCEYCAEDSYICKKCSNLVGEDYRKITYYDEKYNDRIVICYNCFDQMNFHEKFIEIKKMFDQFLSFEEFIPFKQTRFLIWIINLAKRHSTCPCSMSPRLICSVCGREKQEYNYKCIGNILYFKILEMTNEKKWTRYYLLRKLAEIYKKTYGDDIKWTQVR